MSAAADSGPVRTAVVTGGASGIGRAVARRLAADGMKVAVLDIAPTEEGYGLTVDVTDRAQADKATDAVRERLGPVSVLVDAAGKDGFTRFGKLPFADRQRVVDINLNGVFHCVRSALPDMWKAHWGRIVDISSSSTHSGQPFMAHYVAAESAVNGLTKSLALELGPRGITVNAVPPGFVDTPMLCAAEQSQQLGGSVEDHIARTPVRRVGRPEDIAAACSFPVSEEAGHITGRILGVNGGRNT
ncbi:SDR family NAD(P)-dependent oxidoreductase [Streptomyces sp. NPDC050263]|uniref:SDR family NAD(P)-dependent oxidoreductase n=1 Tax=Streptomyces sp. NPDC050263 TaxID=3155037 RepID=UPI00343511E0